MPDADEAPQLLVKLNLSGFQSLQLNVPMLLDKQEHGYTYDLKTLQLPAVVKLQSVDVTLAGMSDAQYRRSVISQVRILKAFQQTN